MPARVLVIGQNQGGGRLHGDLARLGAEVLRLGPDDLPEAQAPEVECVLLDLVAHGGDAAALCEWVAKQPALAEKPLLAVVGEQDLPGFDWRPEIDDLIVVPYRQAEFQARLGRAFARASREPPAGALTAGDLVVDPESYEVRLRGARVDLTLKEYELLKHLMTYSGRVFTRDQLLSSIWGYEYFGGTRTVDVHIRRLRMKLGTLGERAIETVRGVGYVFRP